jgi:hypothetical protein
LGGHIRNRWLDTYKSTLFVSKFVESQERRHCRHITSATPTTHLGSVRFGHALLDGMERFGFRAADALDGSDLATIYAHHWCQASIHGTMRDIASGTVQLRHYHSTCATTTFSATVIEFSSINIGIDV